MMATLPLDHFICIDTVLGEDDAAMLDLDVATDAAMDRLQHLGRAAIKEIHGDKREALYTLVRRIKATDRPAFIQWGSRTDSVSA